jgi:hypothetical protein
VRSLAASIEKVLLSAPVPREPGEISAFIAGLNPFFGKIETRFKPFVVVETDGFLRVSHRILSASKELIALRETCMDDPTIPVVVGGRSRTPQDTGHQGEECVFAWLRLGNAAVIAGRLGLPVDVNVQWLNEHQECGGDDIVVTVSQGALLFVVEVKASVADFGFKLSGRQWRKAAQWRNKYVVIYVPNTFASRWQETLVCFIDNLRPRFVGRCASRRRLFRGFCRGAHSATMNNYLIRVWILLLQALVDRDDTLNKSLQRVSEKDLVAGVGRHGQQLLQNHAPV